MLGRETPALIFYRVSAFIRNINFRLFISLASIQMQLMCAVKRKSLYCQFQCKIRAID